MFARSLRVSRRRRSIALASSALAAAMLCAGCLTPVPAAHPSVAPVPSAKPKPRMDESFSRTPREFLVEVPFTRARNLVVVEAEVAGFERPLRLAIDTGAPTLIRVSVAVEMGLPFGEAVEGQDAHTRSVPALPTVLSTLTIGALEVEDVPAVIVPVPDFDRLCPPIDGLLGTGLGTDSGFLDRVVTEIDPVRGVVRFADRGDKLTPGGYRVPLERETLRVEGEDLATSSFRVPITIGDKTLWATFDTGNSRGTSIPRAIFEELGYRVDAPGVREHQGGYSFGASGLGDRRSWLAAVDHVTLGELVIPRLPVRVEGGEAHEDDQILLGQDVFRRHVLVIDGPGGQARLVPVPVEGGVLSRHEPTTGLEWAVMDEGARVLSVLGGSPANEADVRRGDRVVAVAGVDVTSGERERVCEARAAEQAADPVPVTLRRGDREFQVSLSRRAPE